MKNLKLYFILFIIDSNLADMLYHGIKMTLSKVSRITTNINAKFFLSDCSFVNINVSYHYFQFQEYAPKNFVYFRMLTNEANDFYSSFDSPLKQIEFPVKDNLPEFYTSNNKYLIQTFSFYNFNKLMALTPKVFSHFCKHPASLLPNIVGIYLLRYKTQKYFFMASAVIIPQSRYSHLSYSISADVIDGQSESHTYKRFAEKYPDGLKLPIDINFEYMTILKNDSMFLMKNDMINYTLMIHVLPDLQNLDTSVAKSLKQNSNFAFLTSVNNQNRYKKGIVVRQGKNSQLVSLIYIGIIDLLNILNTWMKVMDGVVSVVSLTLLKTKFPKSLPKDYQIQFTDFISKYAVFY